jgi:hypothetical protein
VPDTPDHPRSANQDPDPEAARLTRLADGLRRVRADRAEVTTDRLLVMAAGGLVVVGVFLVLFGWHGASRTPNVYEQVPYLISGGLLGETLALLGAFLYFGRWLAALFREQRAQGRAVVDAIDRLQQALVSGSWSEADPGSAPVLVATARGSLAHRPDCSVVAGKSGLRPITDADQLAHCRLCLP